MAGLQAVSHRYPTCWSRHAERKGWKWYLRRCAGNFSDGTRYSRNRLHVISSSQSMKCKVALYQLSRLEEAGHCHYRYAASTPSCVECERNVRYMKRAVWYMYLGRHSV